MIVFQMQGDNPVGVSRVSGTTAPAGTLECTAAQATEFDAKGAYFDGSETPRFTFIASALVELTDARPTAAWGHVPGPGVLDGGDWVFDLDVGDTPPTVTVTLSVNVTREELVRLEDSGHLIKLDVQNGVATLTIDTDKPTEYEINANAKVRFTNALRVRVSATTLYAL